MDTKDITELKKARMRKVQGAAARKDLFQPSVAQDREQKQFRKELERAYEREKANSVISKRCTRIYQDHLKKLEPNLARHLIENEVAPELHLTRWLRCMMSREFCLETTLKMWDFIFSGINNHMVAAIPSDSGEDEEVDYASLLKGPADDPFINMECLSLAMIALIKPDLMESDFSMCLGLLMSYKEPEDPSIIMNHAIKVRSAIVEGASY